jgi:hypothetical protein
MITDTTNWTTLQRAAYRSITEGQREGTVRPGMTPPSPTTFGASFSTPDRTLIRLLTPPNPSRSDKWLTSPFLHAKAKVSDINRRQKQLALTKQYPPKSRNRFGRFVLCSLIHCGGTEQRSRQARQ